jgi:hypothetical protein
MSHSEHCPRISVSSHLAERNKPIEIDTDKVGANLENDFPWLGSEDWSRAGIYICDGLTPRLGGMAVGVDDLDRTFASRIYTQARIYYMQIKKSWYKEIKDTAEQMDVDILVLINLDSNQSNQRDAFYKFTDSPSKLLAHELKHCSDLLGVEYTKEELKRSSRVFYEAGAAVAGMGISFLSFVDLIKSNGFFNVQTDAEIMGSGLAIAVSSGYLGVRSLKKAVKMGKRTTPNDILTSEKAVHLYTFATHEAWDNVIKIGEEPYENPKDDWTKNPVRGI